MTPHDSTDPPPTESLITRPVNPAQTMDTRALPRLSIATLPKTPGARRDLEPASGPEPPRPQYELIDIVGRGGMGEVYSAIQVSLGRIVAVKKLIRSEDEEEEREYREYVFRQEAVTAGHLEHPNIVPVHDLGADQDGSPLLAMKLVEGRPWNEMLKDDAGTMSDVDFLAKHLPILIDVAQAVAYAHSRGVVHRDLKPAQVMVGSFGEVLLTDWGLAIHLGSSDVERAEREGLRERLAQLPSRETASNPSGTPSLMAPEQTLPTARHIGTWTDIYLLGGTLYYLLTGTYPHRSGTRAGALAAAEKGEIEPPRLRAPAHDIPEDLERLCLQCLEKDPMKRVPSALEFVKGLQDFLSGASKRRQSVEITTAIAERSKRPDLGYGDYAEGLAKLADARALWPGNPAADTLREILYAGYATAALANEDRVLAGTQARSLREGPERSRLLAEVARADARVLRRERQRRAAFAGVLVLMGSVGALGIWAQRQRIVAEEARGRAEDLMGFMVNDLKDGLKPIGRIRLLEQVADKSRTYFDTLPPSLESEAALTQKAQTLQNVGDIYQLLKRQDAMIDAYERSVKLRRELLAKEPDNPQVQFVVARTIYRSGTGFDQVGRNKEAMERYLESENMIRKLLAKDPENDEWNRILGEILDYRITLLCTTGKDSIPAALALAEEGLKRRQEFARKNPDSYYWARNITVSLERLSRVHELMGRADLWLADRRAIVQMRRDIVTNFPGTPNSLYDLAMALAGFTTDKFEVDHGEVVDNLRESTRICENLLRQDPANVTWLLSTAQIFMSTASYLDSPKDIEEHRTYARRAVELTRQLTGIDPKEPLYLGMLVEALSVVSSSTFEGARVEALASLEEALVAHKKLAEPADPVKFESWAHRRLNLILEHAQLLQAMGKSDEAAAGFLDLVRAADEYSAKKPGVPNIEYIAAVANKQCSIPYMEAGDMAGALPYIEGVHKHTGLSLRTTASAPELVDYLTSGKMMAEAKAESEGPAVAARILTEALALGEDCIRRGIHEDHIQLMMTNTRGSLTNYLSALGDNDAAIANLRTSLGYLDSVKDRTDPEYWFVRARLLYGLEETDDATSITRMLLKSGYNEPSFLGFSKAVLGEGASTKE